MIKRLVLVASVCLSVLFTTNAIAEPYMSDSTKQKYLAWIKEIRQTTHSARFALAVAPNGAYGADWGYTIAQAKKKALRAASSSGEPIRTVPSLSISMVALVSSTIDLIVLPPLPITLPILSGSIVILYIRGA